jgi:hypothetical protein
MTGSDTIIQVKQETIKVRNADTVAAGRGRGRGDWAIAPNLLKLQRFVNFS